MIYKRYASRFKSIHCVLFFRFYEECPKFAADVPEVMMMMLTLIMMFPSPRCPMRRSS